MRVHEPGSLLLPVWNLTSPLSSSTPISYMTRQFRRFANISCRNWHIYVCMDRTFLAQNGGFWGQNRGRGGAMLTPKNSFLLLAVITSVPILVKIDQEMRPWECGQTDTWRERSWCFCLSLSKITKTVLGRFWWDLENGQIVHGHNKSCLSFGSAPAHVLVVTVHVCGFVQRSIQY